jgi:Carboxypeptidase regulatory-like domain/TonB-dependent Receptor Plug Domain
MNCKRFVLLVLMLLLAATCVPAQTFRGTVLGTVTDSSGAVVPGATVKVRNADTGLERSTQTSADGTYSAPELPFGKYTVTVSQSGFQTSVTSNVAVDVASDRRVDVVLKPGEVAEAVEVTGEVPQVDTTNAELGGILTSQTIENIPVNGRDYTKLIYLNPGVAGSPDQISDSPGSFGEFSMNGSRGRSNNYLLDGTDMNDGYRNDPAINEAGVFGDPATILPIDAVGELHVLSNYEAEYGRNSGAIVNIVTKSGTNLWHGSALEYYRSGAFGARNYFNFVGQPKNPFTNNQFGGSLGGPIVKDKAFFFFDYEGQRESGAQAGLSCVPNPALVAQTIASLGSAVSQPMLNLLARNPWPAPNIAGATSDLSGCPAPNLATSTRFLNNIDSLIAKVDYNPNIKNNISGRYYYGNSNQSFPFAQLAGGLLPGFNTVTPTRVQLVALSWVKVVNSAQVNEARLGWNRFAEGFFPQDSSFNPASIGLDTGTSSFDGGLPLISVGGFSRIGASAGVPRQRVDTNWHFIDNYSWKVGRHDIKFGYEFRRTSIAITQDSNFRGKLSFDDLTSFLEGLPSDGSQAAGNTRRHEYENNQGLYVQDSFRWTSRLTLNFGMRWDYFGVPGEENNLFYRLVPAGGGTLVQVGSPGGPSSLYNKDYNNFAPRFGFAYDVGGKGTTVIRGGYGVFYDAFSQDMFLGHIPYNCTFCPGPAYVGIGIAPISFASATSGPIAANSPVYVNPSPLSSFFGVDPNIRTPYVQNWNFNIQQAFTNKIMAQFAYVGSKGTKLFRFRDINQPSQAQITAYDTSPTGGCAGGYAPPNCPIGGFDSGGNVPRTAYPNFFYVNQEESTAGSSYNAFQASLHVTSWHGLSTQANYVWSHSIDNASDLEDFIPNASQPNNSLDTQAERGNSNFDIRQRFSWNFVYQFPKATGSYTKLKNGWGFDGVATVQTGQPFTLNYNFEGDYSGSGEGFDRPQIVGPIQYGSAPNNFLNLANFQVPCTFGNTTATTSTGDSNCLAGTRHFGNLGRNSLVGPSFKEFNFSVFKDTAITERVNLQLRAEFFNLFNHPNFANPELPNFIADPGVNGIASNGRGIGYYALTATGDVGIGNPFLGGGGPRGIQFAAKFTF